MAPGRDTDTRERRGSQAGDDIMPLNLSHSLHMMYPPPGEEEDVNEEEEEEEGDEEEKDYDEEVEDEGDEDEQQHNAATEQDRTRAEKFAMALQYLAEVHTSQDVLFEMKYDFDFHGQGWAVQPTQNGLYLYRYLPRACNYEVMGLCIFFAQTTRVEAGQEVSICNVWIDRNRVITRYAVQKDFQPEAYHDPKNVISQRLKAQPDRVGASGGGKAQSAQKGDATAIDTRMAAADHSCRSRVAESATEERVDDVRHDDGRRDGKREGDDDDDRPPCDEVEGSRKGGWSGEEIEVIFYDSLCSYVCFYFAVFMESRLAARGAQTPVSSQVQLGEPSWSAGGGQQLQGPSVRQPSLLLNANMVAPKRAPAMSPGQVQQGSLQRREKESGRMRPARPAVASPGSDHQSPGRPSKRAKGGKGGAGGKGKSATVPFTAALDLVPPASDRTTLPKMESALVHPHPKKLGDESISLPMSCMTRPPVDTPDGRRSREIREPGEYQVRVLMTSMKRAPCGDHLPFVGMIDPSQCTAVDQVDKQKLREGGYTVWILGGGHSREARSRLMLKHPTVDFYKRYTCYVYVGLTVEEAILVGHEHNRAAGFHKQLTFVQRMRCWRQTFEKLGCDKTLEVKKACLETFADMPYKPWLMMAALDDVVVIPVLTEVKSGILSLDEMAEKFKILKTRQRTAAAFMKEVGVESWEKAKEEFPVHAQEAMLSQYYGLFDKNIKGTPRPMQLYAAKALNYRDKISQHEQHAARTQDPEGLLADWVSFEGEGYKGSVKVMHCDMLQLSDKLEDRLPFTLCIFDFPCGYDADGSAHDAERFTKPQIEASVENFKKITYSPSWVLAGFCSTDMLSDVTSVFSAACNAGVEVGVWVAPNVASPGGLKFTNCWQHYVLAFHNDSGTREPLQFQFNNADSRLNCWSHNAVTKKYVFAADNEILCPYQKPVTLYEWLITKFSDPNDSYIVDAFSRSGTGVVAGLLCKRNVLAVEVDLRCVRGIRAMLAGRDFQESAKQEKESPSRTVAEGWRHA
ncbi:hypothetical protein CBR_g3587 [Chara braunii]|uniref:DNA methylase N-4/N-6 domain-containing protein n=1 Tax=Chara braunii TaxID=69332 RepID=A0A388KFS6_CHABU|nr:hypothetical protein CBR_g3587 [Chara braunii]|eukprot:GBG68889.1 hypothetical protein CBR_g3587 [Chara braunii]